jgi:microcystin-dependent protein
MNFGIPAGAILPFAGMKTKVPMGFLLCAGQSLAKSDYPSLFEIIGSAHGGNATHFNLPDYRGRFLRGVADSTNLDPDRATRTAMNTGGATGDNVGSVQGHAFQTHTHTQQAHAHGKTIYGVADALGPYISSTNGTTQPTAWATDNATALNNNTGATGANSQASTAETRPVNANVLWIIKV